MRRFLAIVLVLIPGVFAQTAGPELAAILQFEAPQTGHIPGGWNGGPPDTVWTDTVIVHGGKQSVRLERTPDSPNAFSSVAKVIRIGFAGQKVELRGFLRTENVTGFVGLWMREDGETPSLAFDNMQARHLAGTTGWTEYSIVLPLKPEAAQLVIGVLEAGTGKAWADDLQLLIDGKPVWEAPVLEKEKTVLESDHEFDGGSKVQVTELSATQVANLVALGKVWGFLKYHHPLVASGEKHWDYELFRVMPKVLAAADRGAANAAIANWISGLGPVSACKECAALNPAEIYLRPGLGWIGDKQLLGEELSAILQSIYRNRPAGKKQFYVSMTLGAGNPVFDHELGYPGVPYSDTGYRLLGVYRFWNMVEYWYPYRDITRENWDQVLAETLPKIAGAKDLPGIQREMIALIARVHDTHANLWSGLMARPPGGPCQLPVLVRFIENRALVTQAAPASKELKVGDEIASIDGTKVATLIQDWTPFYAVSNDAAKLRDMSQTLTRGACGEASVTIRREGGSEAEVKETRMPAASLAFQQTHDVPGPTFRLLSDDVAYLKLSSVKAADAAEYVRGAAKAKGLIIDIRNYPSEFMVFSLGNLLVSKETPFARFTAGQPENPGAFNWTGAVKLSPAEPHYSGKVVVLVDESSQSQAEYTAMAFRAAGATVVGSMTAGADGNVSAIPLPFGQRSMFSGIGVFYPDKTPTQRVGIVPDLECKPTVAGIRAGRDEVLEAAIRLTTGASLPDDAIQKMARH